MHADPLDPDLDFILVILPSTHSPTEILKNREVNILQCIFLPHNHSKQLKTHVKIFSEWIMKRKLRLH